MRALQRELQAAGPAAALDLLARRLEERGDYRAARCALAQARHDLGLPLVQTVNLADLPEDRRGAYEERYVEAIRAVGSKLLTTGDIAGAWAYLSRDWRARTGRPRLDAYEPTDDDPRSARSWKSPSTTARIRKKDSP